MENIQNKSIESANIVDNNKKNQTMEQEIIYKTVKANINGTVENIILGYSIYNMERPKDKADLISLIDKEKMLDVVFHLGNADIFWNEGAYSGGYPFSISVDIRSLPS